MCGVKTRRMLNEREKLVLGVITVPQEPTGDHKRHCFLAACLTVYNYVMPSAFTMDQGWDILQHTVPKTDRIRQTLQRLEMPLSCMYMSGVRYTNHPDQWNRIYESIRHGWPIIVGIGPRNTLSTPTVGHYLVLSGIDNKNVLVHDPWDAKDEDEGHWITFPPVGQPLEGIRASRRWTPLELYFAKHYKKLI